MESPSVNIMVNGEVGAKHQIGMRRENRFCATYNKPVK